MERIKHEVDTVRIASKPDTVVRNRIIYVQSPMARPVLQTVNTVKPVAEIPAKGINMKDKEALERLLVSRSE